MTSIQKHPFYTIERELGISMPRFFLLYLYEIHGKELC